MRFGSAFVISRQAVAENCVVWFSSIEMENRKVVDRYLFGIYSTRLSDEVPLSLALLLWLQGIYKKLCHLRQPLIFDMQFTCIEGLNFCNLSPVRTIQYSLKCKNKSYP